MKAIFYVNTPLEKQEHDSLATLAKANGRSKGQQLRQLVIAGLNAARLKTSKKAKH